MEGPLIPGHAIRKSSVCSPVRNVVGCILIVSTSTNIRVADSPKLIDLLEHSILL